MKIDHLTPCSRISAARQMTWKELKNNFPNPFNPTTTISFVIPPGTRQAVSLQNVYVTLKVYDILGREVATLVDGYTDAGHHQAMLDGSQLATGVYYYTLTAGSFSDTKRLLLFLK